MNMFHMRLTFLQTDALLFQRFPHPFKKRKKSKNSIWSKNEAENFDLQAAEEHLKMLTGTVEKLHLELEALSISAAASNGTRMPKSPSEPETSLSVRRPMEKRGGIRRRSQTDRCPPWKRPTRPARDR